MKISIKGHIKDITSDEINSFKTKAIKTKDKISYIIDNEKYILKINSPEQLILNRETDEISSTMYFELNKTKSSIYSIKNQNINLDINVRTNKIKVADNFIAINYTITDSNNEYEYKIEMSE